MINTLQNNYKTFFQKFVLAWLITTIAFIMVITFSLWQYKRAETRHEFEIAAHQLAFKFDELLLHVLTSMDSIPAYSYKTTTCKKSLSELEKIVFNSPYISGMLISSNQGILCATQGSYIQFKSAYPKALGQIILEPLKLKNSSELYVVQRYFDDYQITTFLLKNIFENLFKNYKNQFDYIGLYDTITKKMIFQIGVNSAESNQNETILALNNVSNIQLVVSKHFIGFYTKLFMELFIYLLPLILLSWWFYKYSKGIISSRFSIEYALLNALKESRFYPVYQPIRDISTNSFCGAEVLIRWKTEFNEIIVPDHFIDDAEKSGIIVPITLQLIESVFQECQPLFQKKMPFKLSFNVSPAHFNDKYFFPKFYELCAEYTILPHQIMLELTERGLFNKSVPDLLNSMQELRSRGYSLAIDDFGTGQANISYLQQFPFNFLKIDQIFVKTIGSGTINETLNEGIINIARSLHLEIIAEGVETEEQLLYFKENKVFLIQGWLHAKAMSYEEFVKLFQELS